MMLCRNVLNRVTFLLLSLGLWAVPSFAQNDATAIDSITPIYVTARVFQLSAPHDKYQEPSDQVFRVSTANYTDEAKWIASLKKTYPGFTPSILTTATPRVFRTSKPQIIKLGKMGDSSLDLYLNGAQSPSENDKPGTTLIAEVSLSQIGGSLYPVTYVLQAMEVESGKTYFFALRSLKLSGERYAGFLRNGAAASRYANDDVMLLFAFSIELEKPNPAARYFGERDSLALQNDATKKVQPVIPDALKQAGLSGKVQIRVEIDATGKVTKAMTQTSSVPEMNEAAIAAARQWEFSPTLFAQNQQPINGLLTFDFPASAK